ncbi:MAG: sigma-54-dependent Fis family transcriptional regulator [Chlorobium limicola]|uniref:sigma-54 interaction domain-containing protein n=1 Tax=Chlorobium limicola TaxID=1092 RepID=UPI0023F193A6|nr:sigma-54 dependent transcriptional regulator [Chlorobium limicola]NTV07292.1 sigma-54-dependent Fis family transcriptional regulator [Chlorobium limicola]NTV20537.1 sigma-54-dependent Fis family transcriptional regulator [Chlorobium limicola]
MRSTILIISNDLKPSPLHTEQKDEVHLKTCFAANAAEAEMRIKEEHPHLILVALDNAGIEPCSFSRHILDKKPAGKIMFFTTSEELTLTFDSLKQLPPGQLEKILVPEKEMKAPDQSSAQSHGRFDNDGLIGNSPELQKIKEIILKIAPTCSTVLLQGESGTGKEVIARSIHAHSNRKNGIFMPVDCAAINESVIESELFGHTRGAFTGADRNTLGLIRSSDGGTLFLDEIAELPMLLQSKLLRTLQERAVKPVGSSKIYPVDIRIIAAANSNLAEAVKKGIFRQDLYYRLNTVTIFAPPLRERLCDIPRLCTHFTAKLIGEGYPRKSISSEAIAALCSFNWPGNIRELENVIRRALTLSKGDHISPEDLSIPTGETDHDPRSCKAEPASMAFHEKETIRKALNHTTGNRRAAAKLLGISEATLYRRIKLYSI